MEGSKFMSGELIPRALYDRAVSDVVRLTRRVEELEATGRGLPHPQELAYQLNAATDFRNAIEVIVDAEGDEAIAAVVGLRARVAELEAELLRVRSERDILRGWNAGALEAVELRREGTA
jgi:hypothetical protein